MVQRSTFNDEKLCETPSKVAQALAQMMQGGYQYERHRIFYGPTHSCLICHTTSNSTQTYTGTKIQDMRISKFVPLSELLCEFGHIVLTGGMVNEVIAPEEVQHSYSVG